MESQTELLDTRGPQLPAAALPANPVLLAHRALRGRYVLAITLALIAGLIGAAVGWSVTRPNYASQGWIRAFPRQPRVLYETEENAMMPMFDAFVRSQAELLKSRRVIDLAISEPSLREAGWPAAPQGVQRLINSLDVAAQRGSELIGVTVSDQDPILAQTAANAVLSAFMHYQEEQEGLSASDREQRLRENQTLLNSELKNIRDAMIRVSDPFGGGDLDRLLDARSEQLARLEAALADPALALAAPGQPAAPPPGPEQWTVEELAASDPVLASLLAQRIGIELDIATAARALGPDHREHGVLRSRLEGVNSLIDKRAEAARTSLVDRHAAPGRPATVDPAAMQRHYEEQREQAVVEIRALSRARMEMKALRDREQEAETRLAETSQALDVIRVENEIIRGGRVRIQQRAPTPIEASADRRIPLAGGGFIAGSGSVIALFVLGSLAQRRLRYADELQVTPAPLPLIGVIPEARGDVGPELSSLILSLHHIRNSLLLYRRPDQPGATVFLVTSAVQGEGKTTVAIALGASFAQAGYRTTLVDCDLVGRGMTQELGLADRPGVVDAIGRADEPLSVEPVLTRSLSVLPAGQCDAAYAHRLTLEGIRPMVDELRNRADIIIVDTGPILGSLEVGLLGQFSDSVLLVAARGTGRRLVNAAIERAGALIPGGVSLVFNRAHARDLTTSASYSSYTSRPDSEHRSNRPDRGRLARLLAPLEAQTTEDE